jgi:F0F1-type ATP synthase assembly protein I
MGFGAPLRKVGPYLDIGLVFAILLVLGVFLGRWLDARWGTEPWMLLVGALLGMASGFYHFFKVVLGRGKRGGPSGKRE